MLIQRYSPIQRPQITASLAHTMELLELTAGEIEQRVNTELASNPALEYDPSMIRQDMPHGLRDCSGEPIVFTSPREDFYQIGHGGAVREDDADDDANERMVEVDSLPVYVLRQIAAELKPEDREIAAHLLTSLDEDGLLSTTVLEVARFFHTRPSRVLAVQEIIQRADPVGVGSCTPQDAMLVQVEVLRESGKVVPPGVEQAIQKGLSALGRRAYGELAQLIGVRLKQAKAIADFIISNLNPYPARAAWGEEHTGAAAPSPNVYTAPDIVVRTLDTSLDSPLVVEIISPYSGALRVNPLFKAAIDDAPAEKREQWRSDLERASLLVKCLHQRDNTMIRLMKRLAVLQRDYFLYGDSHHKPITRHDLAIDLGVHESTISRAVANKAVQLPNGKIVPMDILFDRSLAARTALRQAIAEHPNASDEQLAKIIRSRGFDLARRTIAKYRDVEGILPARLRQ